MTMNEESNSKQTFSRMWICQSPPLSISQLGALKETVRQILDASLLSSPLMHPDLGGLRAILTEVEEVSPLPNAPTKKQSLTEEQSLKSTMCATLPATEEVVGYNFGDAVVKKEGTAICKFCHNLLHNCVCD